MTDGLAAPPVGSVGATPPSLAIVPIVDAIDRWPSPSAFDAENVTGMVRLFAGDYEPLGRPVADGRMLSAADYPCLNDLTGGCYGASDDGGSFALPDLHGRSAIGLRGRPGRRRHHADGGDDLDDSGLGMLPADGRLLPIAEYSSLHAVIGTRYGGDGVSDFALPDLGGPMIVGSAV